jgi:hypothetical protein
LPRTAHVAPLVFVLTITVVKEGYDNFQRYNPRLVVDATMLLGCDTGYC